MFFVKTSSEDIPMEVNSLVTASIKDSFLITPVVLQAAAPIAALIAVSLPITDRQIPVASIRARRPLILNLSIASGLPTPKVFIINDSAPNAFATGRDPQHAAIAFTSGILDKLTKQELEGVAAHELSHIGNFDTRLMTIVSILVGTVALAADFFLRISFYSNRDRDDNRSNGIFMILGLVMALLAPIVATLIQLSISRKRELLADASGVIITRNPDALADALEKISKDKEPLEVANKATAHLYISDPLKNQKNAIGWFANLFNTHPPIAQRVKVLRAMQ